MNKITIKKGKHSSGLDDFPFKFFFNAKEKIYMWEVQFTEKSKYDLKDLNQKDWNKLLGVSFSIFPKCNSLMVGWRYNIGTDKFELSPYTHDSLTGYTKYIGKGFETKNLLSVPTETKITIKYNALKNTLDFIHNDNTVRYYIINVKPRWFGREVSTYFGGNKTAPNNIELLKSKVNVKK